MACLRKLRNFLSLHATMVETLTHYYTAESKQQSVQWLEGEGHGVRFLWSDNESVNRLS